MAGVYFRGQDNNIFTQIEFIVLVAVAISGLQVCLVRTAGSEIQPYLASLPTIALERETTHNVAF
jgi:hypothetical protein